MFQPTPKGHKQARNYMESIGKGDLFESIKDSYLQVHEANKWLTQNEKQERNG